jgi:hypothetical protein
VGVNASVPQEAAATFAAETDGDFMTQCDSPTIEQLLADSLIRAVMRADHVEPEALKSLMERTADRIALGPQEHKTARGVFFVNSAFGSHRWAR